MIGENSTLKKSLPDDDQIAVRQIQRSGSMNHILKDRIQSGTSNWRCCDPKAR